MQKLRLDPDALRVETFAPADLPAAKGTVDGYAETQYCTEGFRSCEFGTCYHSICICIEDPDYGPSWDCVYPTIDQGYTCEPCVG